MPFSQYTLSLFTATGVVAMSRLKGWCLPAGAATEIGLVPNTGTVPCVGTMVMPRAEVVTMPIMPASAAMSL